MVLRFFMLAGVFLFMSCGTIERNNPNDPGSKDYQGYQIVEPPSVGQSSSSTMLFSSSSEQSSGSNLLPSSSSSVVSSSSSEILLSSSSTPSSSSSVPQSSSSVVLSSSSVVEPSSSSMQSSSSSVMPSSSSLAQSSSSTAVSSSSSLPSSSSVAPIVPSSSSVAPTQTGIIRGTPVNYEGENYETVVIGSQTWMARNLNYNVSGSKCGNGSTLSSANTTTCDTYGRLYDWVTAMKLPASCNTSSCASQVGTKHRGICPSGWHIPSDAEWTTLTNFVGGLSTAGKYLKATSGWNGNDNGEDKFGFSALPGGNGSSGGSFYDVGYNGLWWSASEYDSYYAYSRYMSYDNESVAYNYDSKLSMFSVRCLQD
jgi:uncharacterized protein (TIGR02145 family)